MNPNMATSILIYKIVYNISNEIILKNVCIFPTQQVKGNPCSMHVISHLVWFRARSQKEAERGKKLIDILIGHSFPSYSLFYHRDY